MWSCHAWGQMVQVQMSFNAPTPQLQPLPIMGLMCQWSLDFVGSLNLIIWHNLYVLVMIEHFLKWLVMWLSIHSNEGIAYAFIDKMLSKFSNLAEVLIDQGT